MPPNADNTHITDRDAALSLQEEIERLRSALQNKTRELEIEASTEIVRQRAMAMKNSEELKDLVATVFSELTRLGISPTRCLIMLFGNQTNESRWWMANSEEPENPGSFYIQQHDHEAINAYYGAWKNREQKWTYVLDGKTKESWDDFLFNETELANLPLPVIEGMKKPTKVFLNASFNNIGNITLASLNPLVEEEFNILLRFSKVFEQAYTRFLDLQKAEAQAREASIEASLERVRSCSLAMHTSSELGKVVSELLKNLHQLGFENEKGAAALILIFSKDSKDFVQWSADPFLDSPVQTRIPYADVYMLSDLFEAKKAGLSFFVRDYTVEQKNEFFKYAFELPDFKKLPNELKQILLSSKTYTNWTAIGENSAITVNSLTGYRLTEVQIDIIKRFAKAFEQAYTRFLDLQKAEAQAREAQLELSLERIRAKVTAMQESSDLLDIVVAMRNEFTGLGHEAHYFWYMRWLPDKYEKAMTSGDGTRIGMVMELPRHIHGDIRFLADWEKSEEPAVVYAMDIDAAVNYIDKMITLGDFKQVDHNAPTLDDIRHIGGLTFVMARSTYGEIGYSLPGVVPNPPAEDVATLVRFAGVFDLAYRRFEDLKQAEKQNRQTQIELALERVRSRTMGMHKSEELKDIIQVVYEQLTHISIPVEHAGFIMDYKERDDMYIWLADKNVIPFQVSISYFNCAHWNSFIEAKKNNSNFFANYLDFEEKNRFYEDLFKLFPVPEETKKHYFSCPGLAISTVLLENVGLYIENFSGIPYTDEENKILMRFGKVFQQTYTRFLDLQKAEAQTREAQIEAALERVRSKAMAMHSSKDLADTIVAFYHELANFSITPRRCGVGLINKETRMAELSTINTTNDGSSIEIIGTLKLEDHPVLEGVYTNWLLHKEYHPVLKGAEIPAYYRLVKKQIDFPEYPDDAVQYGYFFFFPEGGVYAWTENQMAEEELAIYRRFTSVLSLTYKRYKDLQQAEDLAKQAEEDLVKLKIEKKKTEDALLELKNTQSQLIQSEKMASLGELTAGIAHEIQNPLNFVNNFSEVSAELLGEMKECLSKGEVDAANEIAEDVKENLEKILHHGQRADAIVKSMLQHSRSSNSQKEPTDLNALADEYVRLAFHGWRAKDNSFNATFTTDFDKSIGKLNIISQDIGRVVLNLLNNAFYAVNDKYKKEKNGYDPTVQVSTKKIGNKIEIHITDNANGIPKSSLEKIFQPFFTTKPTGQGTGLGLSLSYDIIKAHNGELKVETSEGKGSTFIIQLPVT